MIKRAESATLNRPPIEFTDFPEKFEGRSAIPSKPILFTRRKCIIAYKEEEGEEGKEMEKASLRSFLPPRPPDKRGFNWTSSLVRELGSSRVH